MARKKHQWSGGYRGNRFKHQYSHLKPKVPTHGVGERAAVVLKKLQDHGVRFAVKAMAEFDVGLSEHSRRIGYILQQRLASPNATDELLIRRMEIAAEQVVQLSPARGPKSKAKREVKRSTSADRSVSTRYYTVTEELDKMGLLRTALSALSRANPVLDAHHRTHVKSLLEGKAFPSAKFADAVAQMEVGLASIKQVGLPPVVRPTEGDIARKRRALFAEAPNRWTAALMQAKNMIVASGVRKYLAAAIEKDRRLLHHSHTLRPLLEGKVVATESHKALIDMFVQAAMHVVLDRADSLVEVTTRMWKLDRNADAHKATTNEN